MRHFFLNHMLRLLQVMTAMAILTGCDSAIYDEEGDCEPVHIIRFRYDMNMKFADAFPAEVPSVDLYVFDSKGSLVTTVSRYVGRDEAQDFEIELRGLAPGRYSLLAWCGVKDSKHFKVNPAEADIPAIENLICRTQREEENSTEGHIREDIGRLYHGRLDNIDMTAEEGRHEHTVRLTKNTNIVRVVLQHLSGAPMNPNDYDITITDENGLYNYDNNLLRDMQLTYHPWSIKAGEASFHKEDEPESISEGTQTSVSAVISEMTVGRLMAGRRKKAALTVRDGHTGALILSIPVIDYMLMVKGHYYSEDGISPMSDQEYLDRQDEYPMTFFLDDRDEWIKTVIYINSWRVVLNNTSVH